MDDFDLLTRLYTVALLADGHRVSVLGAPSLRTVPFGEGMRVHSLMSLLFNEHL